MLVLTRRSGESIVIGNDVRVRVLGSSGSRVRLGIEAPLDVRILREKAEPQPAADTPASEATPVLASHTLPERVASHVAASRHAVALAGRSTTLD